MLWRLTLRLLFKACLPLVALAGVMTYGLYLKGGDPGALWQGLAERGIGQIGRLFDGARQDADQAVSALGHAIGQASGSEQTQGKTEVFTWQDADGVTHYSNRRPDHADVGTVLVDPNVNVLAPVTAPPATTRSPGRSSHDRSHDDTGQGRDSTGQAAADSALPGVAGQVLGARSQATAERAVGSGQVGDTLPGVDPSQLLRMLQQVHP